jgi:hypothetical protein
LEQRKNRLRTLADELNLGLLGLVEIPTPSYHAWCAMVRK